MTTSFATVTVKGISYVVDPSVAGADINHPPADVDVDLPVYTAKRLVENNPADSDRDTLTACLRFTLGMAGFTRHTPTGYDTVVAKEHT
jgi:hypothetical protein